MLPFGACARNDGLTRVAETVVAVRVDDDPLGRQAADGCIAAMDIDRYLKNRKKVRVDWIHE